LVTVAGLRPSGRLDEITRTGVRVMDRCRSLRYGTNGNTDVWGVTPSWKSLVSSYLSRSPGRKWAPCLMARAGCCGVVGSGPSTTL